jgi:transglutaminase-like putative cysteine protease
MPDMIRPESGDLRGYLEATQVVDCGSPIIRTKAEDITNGATDDLEKAREIFEWVRDEIPHSRDIDSDLNPCKASEVLKAGTGMCYAKSHLLAALLRAINIPSGFCYQVLRRPAPFTGFVLHGLNGVYMRQLNEWIRLDSRGNTGSIDAQFNIKKEQLAFQANPAKGEFTYEIIYYKPAPDAVDVLSRFASRREMWPNLPSRLRDEDP